MFSSACNTSQEEIHTIRPWVASATMLARSSARSLRASQSRSQEEGKQRSDADLLDNIEQPAMPRSAPGYDSVLPCAAVDVLTLERSASKKA